MIQRLFAALLLLFLSVLSSSATEPPRLKLGLMVISDGPKRDVEFQQYGWMKDTYRKERIEASFMPWESMYQEDLSREQLGALLRGYHVIHLCTTKEAFALLGEKERARAKVVGEALADYVKGGGGLFINAQAVRYPNMVDQAYWDLVFEPLGLKFSYEGAFDSTRQFEATVLEGRAKRNFWFTRNFSKGPILHGVRGLCLPQVNSYPAPGIVVMKYSDDWEVIVRGEKEAKSYVTSEVDHVNRFDQPGTIAEGPAVVAVRQFGKGRIVSYPLARPHSGINHLNPVWPDTVENIGCPEKGWPSDSMRLQLNAYRWVGEPSVENPEFGTHQVPPVVPPSYPKSVSWDNEKYMRLLGDGAEVRGIIGARSSLSTGKGSVAEYVEAAKAAGLKFVVFTDPLEALSAEKLDRLKAACAEASTAGEFLAIPGIQFTDGAGIRWAMWGERVVFPDRDFPTRDGKGTYPLWDGQRVLARGYYVDICGAPGSAVLSYKGMRENKAHPENLWWYFHHFPRVYEDNQLVEDQYHEYLFALRDMRGVALLSYTGIERPDQVAAAAATAYTSLPDLDSVHKAFNSRFQRNVYGGAWWPNFYVSEGPRVVEWNQINRQLETNWRYTRGGQRVRLKFKVTSDAGIAEVKVRDADSKVFRRFEGGGAKELVREFEMVHDRTHYPVLEVTDTNGRKAYSQYYHIFCYKQSLFRCGDNLNILGPLGMQWHPDRNQWFDANKNLQNASDFEIYSFDTSIPLVPQPVSRLSDVIGVKGVGAYPTTDTAPGMTSKLMDVALNSYNVQIATMTLENLAERFDTETRPGPSWGSSPRDVAENEYYRRTHRMISLEDRIDWFTAWNLRRGREARKDYRGSFNWHEGEIVITKDITLEGAVPIPLLTMECPTDVAKGLGSRFIVSSKVDDVTDIALNAGLKESFRGTVVGGGFLSQLPTLVGYHAFLPAPGAEYSYHATLPGRVVVGMGRDGDTLKAGTVLKYRFAVATFTDTRPDAQELRHTVQAMNFEGGRSGYPVEVELGRLEDATFFLKIAAKDGEARFQVGPQRMNIDLPIIVEGVRDNGVVAVYSKKRPWYRFVPVAEGAVWFQERVDEGNELWVGNLFTADHPAITMTAVIDGQNRNRVPFVEVHNPTEQAVKTTLRTAKHAPEFSGLSTNLNVPAGESVRVEIRDGKLVLSSGL